MILHLSELSLVLLIGPSGSGKTTFAHRHFLPTEIVSSGTCRAMVCDDEGDLARHQEGGLPLGHVFQYPRPQFRKRAAP